MSSPHPQVDVEKLDELTMENMPYSEYEQAMVALLEKTNAVFQEAKRSDESVPVFIKYATLFCGSLNSSSNGWAFAKEGYPLSEEQYEMLQMNISIAIGWKKNRLIWNKYLRDLEYCEEMLYIMSK